MFVLAFITDFFFQAKVSETAKQVGAPIKIATSLASFESRLEENPSLILIDLASQEVKSPRLVSRAKECTPDTPVIVFAAHVNVDLLRQAVSAGADRAMPRSEFSKGLPEILGSMLKKDPAGS